MIVLILKFILAHLIGDFFLQPQKWVKDKEKKKLKSLWLYIHIAVHIGLMFLIVWDLSYAMLILTIGLIHLIIDALKLILQRKKTKRFIFFVDQFIHLVSILVIVPLFYTGDFIFPFELDASTILLITCITILTKPTSIIMKTIISKWNISKLTKDNESLKDAGKYIGILERILVFIFVIIDQWEAVGFLITAKSVFRFGDLTAAKERKLTEYVLIGTLISFGIAIIIGLTFTTIIKYV